MSGSRPGKTPSSPSYRGSATNEHDSSKAIRSGVTTTQRTVRARVAVRSAVAMGIVGIGWTRLRLCLRQTRKREGLRHLLRLLDGLVDAADVQERVLR